LKRCTGLSALKRVEVVKLVVRSMASTSAVSDTDAAPPRPKPTMVWKKLTMVGKLKDLVPGRRINKVRSGDTKSPPPTGESLGASEEQKSSDPTSLNQPVQDTSRETLTASTRGLRANRISEIVSAKAGGQTHPSGPRPTDYSKTLRRLDELLFPLLLLAYM
jgi:hypothetical protein